MIFSRCSYDTVHTINAKDYTKSQLDVWATGKTDIVVWNKSFLEHNTLVAEDDSLGRFFLYPQNIPDYPWLKAVIYLIEHFGCLWY